MQEVINKDKSEVKHLFFDCGQEIVPIKVILRKSNQEEWHTGVEYKLERFASAAFGATLEDFDNDGFFDFEVTTSCGNSNCHVEVYRLDPEELKFYHFYSGVSIFYLDNGYLISRAKSSCCSWEFHVHKIPNDRNLIDERKKIEFNIGVEMNKENKVTCQFSKMENGAQKTISPPNKRFLKYCKHYGEKYTLKK